MRNPIALRGRQKNRRFGVRYNMGKLRLLKGKENLVGCVNARFRLRYRPGVVSQAIDPGFDGERTQVGADLTGTGFVKRSEPLARANPLTEGLTATGPPGKQTVVCWRWSSSPRADAREATRHG